MSENEELEFENPLEEDVETIDVASDKRKIYTELGRIPTAGRGRAQVSIAMSCQAIAG